MVTKNILMFLAGFFSCAFVVFLLGYGSNVIEIPYSKFSFRETSAPSDFISEEDIIVYPDVIVIRISNASISRYASTGSMKPLFDKGANGIRVVPKSEEEINVGDIVSFRHSGKLVVHRVVEKGYDSEGVYFVTKGDNNGYDDGKIRFNQIEYKTIGVIW